MEIQCWIQLCCNCIYVYVFLLLKPLIISWDSYDRIPCVFSLKSLIKHEINSAGHNKDELLSNNFIVFPLQVKANIMVYRQLWFFFLFWQKGPFLEIIYICECLLGTGCGKCSTKPHIYPDSKPHKGYIFFVQYPTF